MRAPGGGALEGRGGGAAGRACGSRVRHLTMHLTQSCRWLCVGVGGGRIRIGEGGWKGWGRGAVHVQLGRGGRDRAQFKGGRGGGGVRGRKGASSHVLQPDAPLDDAGVCVFFGGGGAVAGIGVLHCLHFPPCNTNRCASAHNTFAAATTLSIAQWLHHKMLHPYSPGSQGADLKHTTHTQQSPTAAAH